MHGISQTIARLLIPIGLSIILIAVSCSNKEIVFEPAPFNLNAELVDPSIQIPELGLQFSPPADWKAFDSTQLDSFRKMLGGTDLSREFYPIFPLVAYADSASGCMMYISQIEEADAELDQIAEQYLDFLSPRLGTSALTQAYYLISGTKINYFLVRTSDVVNYKLIGESTPGRRFLIEFIINSAAYTQLEPTVASSLASLKPTTASDENP